jgi:hypothetical protein
MADAFNEPAILTAQNLAGDTGRGSSPAVAAIVAHAFNG